MSTKYTDMAAHGHWSTFDMQNEGQDFNRLQAQLERGNWSPTAERSLLGHAQTVGYADADSHLSDGGNFAGGDTSGESDYAKALQHSYENYQDGEYFSCISTSHNKMHALLKKNIPLMARVNGLISGMRKAYERGREMREEEQRKRDKKRAKK